MSDDPLETDEDVQLLARELERRARMLWAVAVNPETGPVDPDEWHEALARTALDVVGARLDEVEARVRYLESEVISPAIGEIVNGCDRTKLASGMGAALEAGDWKERLQREEDEWDELEAERYRLREALAFYADNDNWRMPMALSPLWSDHGDRARAALNPPKP